MPSGFASLDARLGGGWPLGILTEVLADAEGIGELSLLAPALSQLSNAAGLSPELRQQLGVRRSICWVMPPYIPYAPALLQQRIDLAQVLVVNVEQSEDALWAMEQALRSGICAAVLGWFTRLDARALRRLQLLAETAVGWVVVFRHSRFVHEQATAPLRLRLQTTVAGLQVEVLRNRYGATGSVTLSGLAGPAGGGAAGGSC